MMESVPVTKEWVDHIVGRNWEIFWGPDGDDVADDVKEPTTNENQSPPASKKARVENAADVKATASSENAEEDEVDEADWYAGRVVKFLRYEQSKSRRLIKTRPIFQVLFVGDEELYEQCLTPEIVRPCARSWVRRTLSLLDAQQRNSTDDGNRNTKDKLDLKKPLHNQLPPDTRRLQDEEELLKIRNTCAAELETVQNLSTLFGNGVSASKADLPRWHEHGGIREMIVLIQEQIHLRSWLKFSDNSNGEDGDGPSNSYVNFLVGCLESAKRCCIWYDRCYVYLFHVLERREVGEKLSHNDMLKLFGVGGKQTMADLIALDPSFAGFKRKRKGGPAGPPSKSRRTKSRRRAAGSNYYVEDESGERYFNADPEDFNSRSFLRDMVSRFSEEDQRWFALSMGRMLLALSDHVVLPVLNWGRQTDYFLGKTESASIGDMEGNNSSSRTETSPWITLDQVESLVESARSDVVLAKFDFDSSIEQLTRKTEGILSFEKECWSAIEKVTTITTPDPDEDDVLQNLQSLLDTTKSRLSSVGNVEPFGREASPLTRSALESVSEYRRWILDLKQAESRREREIFVAAVVEKFDSLPDLPSREGDKERIAKANESIEPRVRALASSLNDNDKILNSHKQELEERDVLTPEKESALDEVIKSCQKTPVVSVPEEMAMIRKDVFSWLDRAKKVLDQERPPYDAVDEMKSDLDLLEAGKSSGRIELTRNLRQNNNVDSEICEHARLDLRAYCQKEMEQISALHSAVSPWCEKSIGIMTTLLFHGNPAITKKLKMGASKHNGMVDLRRIEDLLEEYLSLKATLTEERDNLRVACDECYSWSERVTELLLGDTVQPFGDLLAEVEAANKPEGRPRGIILSPTRQALDFVVEILKWHGLAKSVTQSKIDDPSAAYQVLLEGLEIVELYGKELPGDPQYVPRVEDAIGILRRKLDSRKAHKSFSRAKIESQEISKALMHRMVTQSRDREEGWPLHRLLLLAWQIDAESFAEGFLGGGDKSEFTLEAASRLKAARPRVQESIADSELLNIDTELFMEFNRLVDQAMSKKEEISSLLLSKKSILRDCLRRPEIVKSHLTSLKESYADLKKDSNDTRLLGLPPALSANLEKEIKLFAWLARAVHYPKAFSDEDKKSNENSQYIERVPLDVLHKLHDSSPDMIDGSGDFAMVVVRVKELHESANKWQNEVSNLTLLSMRGGKRRAQQNDGSDGDDGQQRIDLAKVVAMSNHPILKRVAMPREDAIRSMLKNTKRFEVLLQDLLAEDYSGKNADRIVLPHSGSLVDFEGRFILLRFTGSPLYLELKVLVEKISSVADDVLADTPGKATFDWICKAIQWIESLSVCVDRDNLGHGYLSIPKSSVEGLLAMADAMLLNVPDDLRKLLSKHGILVSTTREGRLSVKSKKGGAHHSLGITAIRWSPILFEALKEDAMRTYEWESAMSNICARCLKFRENLSDQPTRDIVLKCHVLLEELSETIGESSELVVMPQKQDVDAGLEHETALKLFIQRHSTTDIESEFAESSLAADASTIENRSLLLDSLVDRAVVTRRPIEETVVSESDANDLNFRATARILIGRAFEEGIVGIGGDLEKINDANGLCKLKAWEIEEVLYKQFQPKSEDRMSPRYRDKVRSLRRAFSDPSNCTLCLQVICSEIDADHLLKMSPEQLANPDIRRSRELAETKAKEKTVLTRSAKSKTSSENGRDAERMREEQANGGGDQGGPGDDGSDAKPASGTGILNKKPSLKETTKRASAAPPPPPPSLADSLQSARTQSSSRRASNASGSDRFTLSISDQKFSAYFNCTPDLPSEVEDMLPERMRDEGRTRVDEFVKFLAGKQSSGHWNIYTLRLLPCTDSDARQYKKFYKDFELKERIAMFKIGTGKLFLITPRFHRKVKDLLELRNSQSTYGVLLKKIWE